MKVICINDNWKAPHRLANDPTPKFGDIDTVLKEGFLKGGEIPAYLLDGYKNGYAKDHFAPLSEIDETTFERNYQKELV